MPKRISDENGKKNCTIKHMVFLDMDDLPDNFCRDIGQ